jgi:hypothetical protein
MKMIGAIAPSHVGSLRIFDTKKAEYAAQSRNTVRVMIAPAGFKFQFSR